jgi:hypothetical protein
MSRTLVWIEKQNFSGWGCSECEWVSNISEPPIGNSLDEMIQNFLHQRDEDFAAHDCTERPRAKKKG